MSVQPQQVVQQASVVETKLLKFDQQLTTFVNDLGKEVKIAEEDLYSELTKEQQTMVETKTVLQELSAAGQQLRALMSAAGYFAQELRLAAQVILDIKRATSPGQKLSFANRLKTMEQALITMEQPLQQNIINVELKISTAMTNAKTTLGNQVVGEKLGQAALKNVSKALADTKKMVSDLGVIKGELMQERNDALTELNVLHKGQFGIPI